MFVSGLFYGLVTYTSDLLNISSFSALLKKNIAHFESAVPKDEFNKELLFLKLLQEQVTKTVMEVTKNDKDPNVVADITAALPAFKKTEEYRNKLESNRGDVEKTDKNVWYFSCYDTHGLPLFVLISPEWNEELRLSDRNRWNISAY